MVFDRMFRFVAGLSVLLLAGAAQAQVHVTEWMYSGPGGEFVELTNTGDEPVDLAGWSYDDDSATPGVFDLSGFGEVQPGESVVFTESDAEAFRGEWGLCAGVKILGGYTNNLGRNDQINIFDAGAALADRLTYGDETFPGSIRTQNASGWVSAAGLGADDVFEWTLSTVGDGEDSDASAGGAVGSPGRSTRATVPYDPCDGGGPGTPTIAIDQPVVVGSIGDPTNPPALATVDDPDGPVEDLVITVESTNGDVLPAANVTVEGMGEERPVTFEPTGRGTSSVTFTVTDLDENESATTMAYASSNQAPNPSGRYHHHISDASSALDVGDGFMLLVNDETNTIFLHRQDVSGLPVKTWTFTSQELGTNDEIDFEGMARSGDLLVVTGSHGNSRSGAVRPERRTFVGATITGEGAATELAFLGRYNGLWADLRTWDAEDGHGLGPDALGFVAATAPGVQPNPPGGFNIEAVELAPGGEVLYLGFRAPTIEVEGTFYALLVPVLNVGDIVDGVPASGPALFGNPIFLDLDGRSIRELRANEHDEYLIAAGPSPQNESWALYTWDGDPAHAARFNRLLPDADLLTGGVWEGLPSVPHPLAEGAVVRVVADSGDANFYGTGQTKDLPQPYQKSYSQEFVLDEVPGGAGGIRITEWMYSGPGGEFVELTNTGEEPVDLAGWSYDDDSATPGVFDLSGFGEIQPGESVVFTESDAETFRDEWGLCPGVKILGGYTNNLGRNDQINIFDAADELADVLTYGDEVFPGSIRTQDASGWVSAAGLGADDVYEWTLSTVGDGEDSDASSGGAVGSPGRSTRASVPYDPCDGGVASLAFDPASLDFGDVEVGDTSAPMAATVTNSGGADATGLVFSQPEGGFAADTGACGATLPAGTSCEVMVTFMPAEPGPAVATLHVESAESAAADLDLAGSGVAEGIVTPVALEVDPAELNSDGNGVFEPGELVEVAPAWRNDGTSPQSLSGTAANLTGPDGGDYTLVLDDADYGTLDPGQTASCLETGVCYQVSVDDPAVRPAPHWEAMFDETLDDTDSTTKTWTLHIGDSFVDVPRTNLFYPSIETLLHHGITGGCTGTEYCPTANNTRDQMPVFVLRAVEGSDYEPPACVEGAEVFHDVAAGNVFCPWIEELANRGAVSGCGGDNYCPNAPVTRAQMAIFLLRSLEGSDYEPPACTGQFVDVPCPSLFADWIEELFVRGITGGCSNQPLRYCPANPVNREQMAAFIGKAFELTLYGP